jgi:hypothetical protein
MGDTRGQRQVVGGERPFPATELYRLREQRTGLGHLVALPITRDQ